jgi:molybdate transport system ATP-binding protein
MSIAVRLDARISADFSLDIDIAIPAQGVTALLGPSGSGKTSVLRALAGLDRHPGTIRFGETLWQDHETFVPPHRRHVGYVFQGSGLLPHLTVRQNLSFAISRAPEGPFALEDTIVRTGIGALLDRSPDRLSGGESQRAGIARALMSQPHLLLMDEPLSGLDREARVALLGALDDLLGDIAIPVVYVTHDIEEAARLAVQSIRLNGGKVVS